jgi:hypothetical protein
MDHVGRLQHSWVQHWSCREPSIHKVRQANFKSTPTCTNLATQHNSFDSIIADDNIQNGPQEEHQDR